MTYLDNFLLTIHLPLQFKLHHSWSNAPHHLSKNAQKISNFTTVDVKIRCDFLSTVIVYEVGVRREGRESGIRSSAKARAYMKCRREKEKER